MNEIKCPRCGEVFQVYEGGYAEILKAVRDKEFKKELESRERLIRAENELKLREAMESSQKKIDGLEHDLDAKIKLTRAEGELKLKEELAEKDRKI